MLKFSIFLLLSLAVFASQDIPIPSKPDGFSVGSDTPNLHIEAFYDLLCPDSKKSFEVFIDALNKYDPEMKTLRFTTHMFPLPFHRNSFMTAQGAQVIADNSVVGAGDDIWTYLSWTFYTQDYWSNYNTSTLTQAYVQESFVNLTLWAMPSFSGVFAKGLEEGNQYDTRTRTSWKYGCSRGVTGTPTYMANGVIINGARSFTFDQWVNFMNGDYINHIYI